jgi:FixJ family two-component response regulator
MREGALICVVDDDESVRESLPDLLVSHGFSAVGFRSGAELLEFAELARANCLLLDICMPGMDGFEVQRELTARHHRIPIIFITAHSKYEERRTGLRDKSMRLLIKPFDDKTLLNVIEEAVRSSRAPAPGRRLGTVYIVDDDISVRESLATMLEWAGWRVRTYSTATEFLADESPPDACCLVLDMRLQDMSGLDLQRHMRAAQKEMPIIFISAHSDVPATVSAMKAGAMEFLTKPFEDSTLREAVEVAMEKSRAARREAAALAELHARYASMTAREREVMALVVRGRLNKQIAAELGTAEPTVKGHRGQVMRKMKAASLADLIGMAQTLGLRTGRM